MAALTAPVKPDISSTLPIGGSFEELDIARIKERWSSLPDLPLENATDLEKQKGCFAAFSETSLRTRAKS